MHSNRSRTGRYSYSQILPVAMILLIGLAGCGVIILDYLSAREESGDHAGGLPNQTGGAPKSDSLLRSRIVPVAAGIVPAIILAVLVSRYFTRPIRAIVSDAGAIAAGDRGRRIARSSWKEFSELKDALGQMALDLKNRTGAEGEADVDRGRRNSRDPVSEGAAGLRPAGEAARQANKRLNLLISITRHDILNSLTIVLGFAELARLAGDPAEREAYLRKIETAAGRIRDQIVFTREYQDLGAQAPRWQSVGALISRAAQAGGNGSVRIADETGDLVVFADPLLQRVFYNLITNALVHGGEELTLIRFGWYRHDGDLVITCQDDGRGIPPENKERIFEPGVGTGTGLGLFLSREILAITGMAIQETGQPGRGARFEILVPAGAYRFSGTG